MKRTSFPLQRWLLGGLIAALVLGVGYYAARRYAWPAVKAWRVTRLNREAQAFLTAKDFSNALLTARKSLQGNTQNPAAWRVAAQAAEAKQQPNAVWYQDNLYREEPTTENYLGLVRLALRFDVPGYVLGKLTTVPKGTREDPVFHRLAAQVYARSGNVEAAKMHLGELVRLQPADRTAQMDLAEMELASDSTNSDPALRQRVLALSAQPELRKRALALLLRDQVSRKDTTGMAEVIRRLQGSPDLDLSDRLLVLEGLFLLGHPEAESSLAKLQAEVASKPADVARVIGFLNRTGRVAQIHTWVATLPTATRADENVQRGVAESLLAMHDAPALEAYLRDIHWTKNDFMRQALLAHAYRDEGRSGNFTEAWKLAVLGVGSDLRNAGALLARADEWRWVTERHDVIWKMFSLVPTNESAQQALILWERNQGNTANLNRLFTKVSEVQPGDVVARNNFAYTSLLLDSNVLKASLVAAELAKADPKNPYFVTTYALALFKQGHPAEALARLDALTFSQQAEPVRMLLRAVCLAALGRSGDASDLLNGVVLAGMLPEEKRLAEEASNEITRLDRAQGNRSRLLAFRQSQRSSAAGWLALVAPEIRKTATTDMQLADSLYAVPDWSGLQDLLRTGDWKDADYLRSALLAYVLRQRGEPLQSGEEWRKSIALADGQLSRLQNLRGLVTQWGWASERLETLNLIFQRTPTDRLLLAELLRLYREAGRTADLYRVLSLYVGENPEPTDEAVSQAYYGLLLDNNVARAHVVARNAFETAPGDPVRRIVYAFSLWKQRRVAEAMPLLGALQAGAKSDVVSIPLVRATIQAQMGARAEARASLAQFQASSALPEEVALADKISNQLAAESAALKPPQT